jgi:hypothetical protein
MAHFFIRSSRSPDHTFWLGAAAITLLPLGVLCWLVLQSTQGQFTYSLDDPYIHLALARNIWAGQYGINLMEPSAPSSSILWPFLLAPFSVLGAGAEYVPLLINAACLMASAWLIGGVLGELKWPIKCVLAALLLFSLNAYGLVLTGMEHSLQALLVAAIVRLHFDAAPDALAHAAMPSPWRDRLLGAALVLLVLVRYEGLAISLPFIAYLFVQGQRRLALVTLAVTVGILGLFSYELNRHGLGYLPSSIYAKSSHGSLQATWANIQTNMAQYSLMLGVAGCLAVYFAWRDWAFAVLLLVVTALHFSFGHAGWFGRYEVYYLMFMALVLARALLDISPWAVLALAGVPFYLQALWQPTLQTPLAASNVFHQQVQMAHIARQMGEPVAVNDLGLVALRSGQYVLDLAGLGSIDALVMRSRLAIDGDEGWPARLIDRSSTPVRYAMVYEAWFPKFGQQWEKVGEMHLLQERITPASDVVAFFAKDKATASKLRRVLDDFKARSATQTAANGAGAGMVVDVLGP